MSGWCTSLRLLCSCGHQSLRLYSAPGFLNHMLSHSHQPIFGSLKSSLFVCTGSLRSSGLPHPHNARAFQTSPALRRRRPNTLRGVDMGCQPGGEHQREHPHTMVSLLKRDGCPPCREVSQELTWLAEARTPRTFKVAMVTSKYLGTYMERWHQKGRVKSPGTPDHTLKLGWVDAGEGASLQVGGPFGAGELGIVDMRLVRDTTVNRVTSHRSVPPP